MTKDQPISQLGFGCGRLMRLASSKERQAILGDAYECGIRYFDVARMYGLGQAESELGRFIHSHRDDLIITSKFGIELSTVAKYLAPVQRLARTLIKLFPKAKKAAQKSLKRQAAQKLYSGKQAQESLETSLRCLKTDFVDRFLLHDPQVQDEMDPGLFDWLESAKASGRIREWGIATNFDQLVPLRTKYPVLDRVLQFENDVLNRNITRQTFSDPERIVTFSPFSQAVERIHAWVDGAPGQKSALSQKLGIDLNQADALSKAMLTYCVTCNPRGITLFSTCNRQRIKSLCNCISNSEITAGQIDEFLKFVDDQSMAGN